MHEGNNRVDGIEHNSARFTAHSRRSVLYLSGALGAAGLTSVPAVATEVGEDGNDDERESQSETIEGTVVSGDETSSELANAISTTDIQNQIVSSTLRGATEQTEVFSQTLQDFPTSGDNFVALSTGRAADAPGNPDTFNNIAISNGRSNQDYSPDGYDAFNIVDLEITINLPSDAEGIEFDYKFATEENPEYLDSEFQDFFEVQLYDPNGGVENLALINGDPVTVDNADSVGNSPTGDSINPEPPLPSPQDITYNSVTDLQTITYDISGYQGQSITLVFRIADASDELLDSAVLLDNLQFANDVETDSTPVRNALDKYEQSFKKYSKRQFEAQGEFVARLYNEHGDAYGDLITNYWGYKSGNLSKSAVSDGTREISDSSIETISTEGNLDVDTSDAQILYDFYTDLFSELNENAPLSQLIQTTTQYFLGTHPNQSSYIKFDEGQTMAEGLNQNWNLSTKVYNRLTQETDLTQSDIQRIASGLQDRANRLASRGQQDIESKRRAAKELIEADESSSAEIHAHGREEPVSDQEIEGELAATTIATVGILLTAGGGLAAGYITNKCAGASTAALTTEGVEVTGITLTRPDKAAAGTVTTFLNGLAGLVNTAQQYAEETTESQAFYTSLFTGNFIAGQKAAAVDLASQTAVVFSQIALSQQISADITHLELPNVTESEEMGLLTSFANSIQEFLDDLLGSWYDPSPPQIGAATGSVTVSTENPTGDAPISFKPVFASDYKLFDGDKLAGTAHPFEIKGDMSTMQTGEERTFDIEYKAPLDRGLLSGKGSVEFGVSPVTQVPVATKSDFFLPGICELDYNAMGKASKTASFTVNDAVENETVTQGESQEGEVKTYSYTPSTGTNRTLLTLNYENHYSDLHLYDGQNNEVGYNYDTNSAITEIPGAKYSGRDTGEENSEWISLPVDSGTEYTIETVTPEVGTVGQGSVTSANASLASEYEISSAEISDLPPKLSVTPSTVSVNKGVLPGDTLNLSLVLTEVNKEQAAEDVTVSASDLTTPTDETIDSSNISFSSDEITVSSPTEVDYTIDIPGEVTSGTYSGTFTISASNADSTTVNVEITVGEGKVVKRTVSTRTPSPGGTVEVTIEATAPGSKASISEYIDPPTEDISVEEILANGESVQPVVKASENDAVVVTLNSLVEGDTISITYRMKIPEGSTDSTVYSLDGTYSGGGSKIALETTEITVETGFFEGIVSNYNSDNDQDIDVSELGQAAADYASGDISLSELSKVAQAYAQSN